MDSGLLSDVWFIWEEEGRTKITRVADKEELGSKFFIDAGGDSKEKSNYQLCREVCQNVPLPIRLLLDTGGAKHKGKLIENGIKEEDIIIWE